MLARSGRPPKSCGFRHLSIIPTKNILSIARRSRKWHPYRLDSYLPIKPRRVMMRSALSIPTVLIAFSLVANAAENKKERKKETAADAALKRFKQLAGDWEGTAGKGKDAHKVKVTYKVTSGGSTVLE